jgi:hypothetical protein
MTITTHHTDVNGNTIRHTPGPWTVETKNSYIHVVSPTHVIATISGVPGVSKYAVANSHLVAAAPDLLAALKDVSDKLDRAFEGDEEAAEDYGVTASLHRARTAIANARGAT